LQETVQKIPDLKNIFIGVGLDAEAKNTMTSMSFEVNGTYYECANNEIENIFKQITPQL
jgi:hypothetical protein